MEGFTFCCSSLFFFFHREISEVYELIFAKFCHIVGIKFNSQMPEHFNQFYYRQLKNGQLDKMSAKECELNMFLRVMLIKQSYRTA